MDVILRIYNYNIKGNEDSVESIDVDLSTATSILVNKDIFNLQDITAYTAEYSYPFEIAQTDETARFFENFGHLNFVGVPKYSSYKAEIIKNGSVILRGRFVLQNFNQKNQTYIGQAFGNFSFVVSNITDGLVRDLEYFTPFDHAYINVRDTTVNSWMGWCQRGFGDNPDEYVNEHLEFFYNLVDTVGFGEYHTENAKTEEGTSESTTHVPFVSCYTEDGLENDDMVQVVGFDGFTPPMAVKLLPVIKSILSEAGFNVDMSYYENHPKWSQAYMVLPKYYEVIDSNSAATGFGYSENKSYTLHVPYTPTPTPTHTASAIVDIQRWDTQFGVVNEYIVPISGTYTLRNFMSLYYDSNGFTGELEDGSLVRLEQKLYRIKASDGSTEVLNVQTAYSPNNAYNKYGDVEIDLQYGDKLYTEINVRIDYYLENVRLDVVYTVTDHGVLGVIQAPPAYIPLTKRKLGNYFGEIKQRELLKESLMLSNGVLDFTNRDNDVDIIVKPLINLWKENNNVQMDITSKVHRENIFEVRPATELMPRILGFKWKEGDDFLNVSYKKMYGETYGSKSKVNINSRKYAGDNLDIESKLFKPIVCDYINPYIPTTTHLLYINKAYKDTDKFDSASPTLMLGLYSGVAGSLSGVHKFRIDGNRKIPGDGWLEVWRYPLLTNMLVKHSTGNIYPSDLKYSDEDINWVFSEPFSLSLDGKLSEATNNLFHQYYKEYIDSLYSYDTVIVETEVILTPREFELLDMWAPVMLDGSRYRIISYSDYSVLSDEPMRIVLLKDNIGESTTNLPSMYTTFNTTWYYHNVKKAFLTDGSGNTLTSFRNITQGSEKIIAVFEGTYDTLRFPLATSSTITVGVDSFGATLGDFLLNNAPVINTPEYTVVVLGERLPQDKIHIKVEVSLIGAEFTNLQTIYYDVNGTDVTVDAEVYNQQPPLDAPATATASYDDATETLSMVWDSVVDAKDYLVEIYKDDALLHSEYVSGTSLDYVIPRQLYSYDLYFTVATRNDSDVVGDSVQSNTVQPTPLPGDIVTSQAFRNNQACVFQSLAEENGLTLSWFETWRRNPSGNLILGWDFEFSADPTNIFELSVDDIDGNIVWARSDGTVSSGTTYWDAPVSTYDSGTKTWSIRITNNNPTQSTFDGNTVMRKDGGTQAQGTFKFNGTTCDDTPWL